MRESTRFWIFSFLFILACIAVIVYMDVTRKSDEIYIRDISAANNVMVTAAAETGKGSVSDIERNTGNSGNSEADSKTGGDRININTATAEELTALPGIGETIAKRIIEYREKSGDFLNIEEIMEVNGIGEGKFEAIKDMIVV